MTLNELVKTNNASVRTKAFITYDSKKKFLADNEMLKNYSDEFIELLKQLKNVFSITVNATAYNHIVITMYHSKTKSYEYIACDCSTYDCTSFDSVKAAKQYINEQINK